HHHRRAAADRSPRHDHHRARLRRDPAGVYQRLRRVRSHAAHARDVQQVTAQTITQAAYIVAALLFILSLAGLSKHETSRQGIVFGISGMAIALAATIGLAIKGEAPNPGLSGGGIALLF